MAVVLNITAGDVAHAITCTKEKHPEFDTKIIFTKMANGNTDCISRTDKNGAPVRNKIKQENLQTLDYAKMLLMAHVAERNINDYYSRAQTLDKISNAVEDSNTQAIQDTLAALCEDLENANALVNQTIVSYRQQYGPNSAIEMENARAVLDSYYPSTTLLGSHLNTFDELFFKNSLPTFGNKHFFDDTYLQALIASDEFNQQTGFRGNLATIERATANFDPKTHSRQTGQTR